MHAVPEEAGKADTHGLITISEEPGFPDMCPVKD